MPFLLRMSTWVPAAMGAAGGRSGWWVLPHLAVMVGERWHVGALGRVWCPRSGVSRLPWCDSAQSWDPGAAALDGGSLGGWRACHGL
jgi:hypothetical protein